MYNRVRKEKVACDIRESQKGLSPKAMKNQKVFEAEEGKLKSWGQAEVGQTFTRHAQQSRLSEEPRVIQWLSTKLGQLKAIRREKKTR